MLALGSILAFSGANIPLGIGLLIAGATTMWASASLNWSTMSDQMKEKVGEWTIIASGALLALGAVMLCTGHIGLGIGMIIGGVAGIVSAAALNWNSTSDQLRGTLTSITSMVGVFTLALGAALLFTGVSAPLGIALLAMGATSLAASAALNWDSMKNQIQTVLADIVAIVSGASIALGIILCLTGAGIPLGIGLIMAGLAGSSLAQAISTDPITNWAQNMVDSIVGVFNDGIDRITRKYKDASQGFGGSGFGGGGGGFGAGGSGGIRNALGTNYHPGGPALVNDQSGSIYRELVQLPNGMSFIPQGRNILFPDLPIGTKVLPAAQTKQLFPNYSDGIGELGTANLFQNPDAISFNGSAFSGSSKGSRGVGGLFSEDVLYRAFSRALEDMPVPEVNVKTNLDSRPIATRVETEIKKKSARYSPVKQY